MKTLLLLVLSVLFVASLRADAPAPVGRYQLVAGNYGVEEMHRSTIIKIDTVTGETWELIVVPNHIKGANGTNGNVEVTGWVPIAVSAAAELQKLKAAGLLPK